MSRAKQGPIMQPQSSLKGSEHHCVLPWGSLPAGSPSVSCTSKVKCSAPGTERAVLIYPEALPSWLLLSPLWVQPCLASPVGVLLRMNT